MDKLKVLNLFICIPFLSFGQCDQGQSFLEIFTNGQNNSTWQNDINITSSDGAFYESFNMGSGTINQDYCLDPGIYSIEITDLVGNGIKLVVW